MLKTILQNEKYISKEKLFIFYVFLETHFYFTEIILELIRLDNSYC